MGDRPSDSIGSRPPALSDPSTAVLKSVKTDNFSLQPPNLPAPAPNRTPFQERAAISG
jgi:hypothetical protein